jgi:hypothetical protein
MTSHWLLRCSRQRRLSFGGGQGFGGIAFGL